MAISQSDADEYTNAGTKLKATSGWYNNGNGTDDYGFEALPVGCRNNDGDLTIDGWAANFWSSTANDSGWAWAWGLHYFNEELHRFINNKDYGYSVRCVKD